VSANTAAGKDLGPLRIVLVPTRAMTLLVPSTAVAEVVGFADLKLLSGASGSLLGVFEWRGIRLPLLSVEALFGEQAPVADQRAKVVVFYPLPGQRRSDFFAVLASADPHSRVVSAEQLVEDNAPPAPNQFIARTCMVGGEPAGIPDLGVIRSAFRNWA